MKPYIIKKIFKKKTVRCPIWNLPIRKVVPKNYLNIYIYHFSNKKEKNMEEKILVCQDCNQEFAFTVGEQEFYKEKGFDNEPKRCRECRDRKKNERRNSNR